MKPGVRPAKKEMENKLRRMEKLKGVCHSTSTLERALGVVTWEERTILMMLGCSPQEATCWSITWINTRRTHWKTWSSGWKSCALRGRHMKDKSTNLYWYSRNHQLLNSRSKFNHCSLPRLTVKLGDRDLGELSKMIREEQKKKDDLEKIIRSWKSQ